MFDRMGDFTNKDMQFSNYVLTMHVILKSYHDMIVSQNKQFFLFILFGGLLVRKNKKLNIASFEGFIFGIPALLSKLVETRQIC